MTLRVTGLLHFGLQVPDLSAGEKFYRAFGLNTAERDDLLVVRCEGRDQDQAILTEGVTKRIGHVAFGVEEGALPEWQRHLEELGVTLVDAPRGGLLGGLWFTDPDGNFVNLRQQAQAPWRAVTPAAANTDDRAERVDAARWEQVDALSASPRRLGHVILFATAVDGSERFYRRTLGLRLSDKIPGRVTFMNSGPGDHHNFGFMRSTHPGLHHSSWEVANIDAIAMGAQTMHQNGYQEGWGLGRHTLGSNLFAYIRDPWGSWIEYFSDIDIITEAWVGREWDIPTAVWCAAKPITFHQNSEQAH
jgi:catechol-2,3-dioxygenase